jgi:hypothetical protein
VHDDGINGDASSGSAASYAMPPRKRGHIPVVDIGQDSYGGMSHEVGVNDGAVVREQIQCCRENDTYESDIGDLVACAFKDRVLISCPVSTDYLKLASRSGSWTMRLLGKCERIT